MKQNDSKTIMPSILTFRGGSGGGGGGIGGSIAATQVAYGTAANTIGGDGSFTYEVSDQFLTVTKIRTQVVIEVRNETGSTIEAGRAVYISGSTPSGRPLVAYADANDPTKMPSVGIVTNQIGTGNNGYVAISGQLNGLNTSTFTEGDVLYVDNIGNGVLTNTKPTASNGLIQNVGRVLVSDTNGKIQISNIGRTNDVPNYSFVTTTDTTTDMPNSRYLAAGAGISITDNGAGSTVEIAATGTTTTATEITVSLNENVSAGDVLRTKVNGANGLCEKADNSTGTYALGVAVSNGVTAGNTTCIIQGQATVTFDVAPVAADLGKPVYVGTTGRATLTAPTASGTTVILLGFLQTTGGQVIVNPNTILTNP